MDAFAKIASVAAPPVKKRNRLKFANDLFVNHATVIAIASLTLVMFCAAFIFYVQGNNALDSRERVTHTYEVKTALHSLLARIEDAVIGERGFLIGGREEYLKSYVSAVEETNSQNTEAEPQPSIASELANLKKLIADNPEQVDRLEGIEQASTELLARLAAMIKLRKSEGVAALQKIDPYQGEQLLEHLRILLGDMTEEENQLLVMRQQADAVTVRRNNLIIFGTIVAFYLIVVAAIRLCQKAEKLAQKTLRDNEQRYSLAVQGLSAGLWDWTIPTGEIYWSPRFREILGIADKDFIPTLDYIEKNLHPEDRETTMKQLYSRVRNEERAPYDHECRLLRPDGKYVWLHSRGQALWDKAGNIQRMVGCVEDITARKESERQIQQHIAALKRSNQELDDFAYIASHDLKEPLRGLSNNAMFLKEDFSETVDPSVVKRLDRMTFLCKRLERLVDDLLYFSRLGRQELAIQRTDINELIADIKLTMEATLKDNNAVIVTPKPLPVITCDLPRVTEVFRNLIMNAVKYNNSAEKRIEIGYDDIAKLSPDNDNRSGRAFYVRDNGIGISKQFYTDIFRIFKRLNDETDDVKGTGVGLTFVRKIIERHGGRIWLDSETGKGTTFYFTLNTKTEGQNERATESTAG